ncbi:SDR family NAD(P)-dependent oxidoreductase [Spirochaeta lutea]|uniref:Short-chain dehydrogenase n=1 Tax=Spirochaeta lutea TaxID=1480694 RepID=A0A098R1Q2_9SPIO|nr:SDR family oxidoreductase [Spirochaeta lutea]KGE73889.1 hypothetical protein DC28_01420 [Spirochaeta lutea]
MKLDDKRILVTGGTSGIGEASCQLFCREGAQVIFVGRREDRGVEVQNGLRGKGFSAEYWPCDISREDQLDELFAYIRTRYGRLDGAFNCGGIDGEKASILDSTLEEWDKIMNVNLRGTFMLVQRELKMMVPQGHGSIVNMSSVCGTIARQGRVAYTASRHGVDAITKTAALEFASKGIRINAVAPGSVRTDIFYRSTQGNAEKERMYNKGHPIGRIGEPEEIARAALWLLSEAPDFLQGHTMMIDGGFTVQ